MFKKRIMSSLILSACLALAVPSVARAMDEIAVNKVLSVQFSLKEQPTDVSLLTSFEVNDLSVSYFSYLPAIELFDYGSDAFKQVNSNELAYKESNILTANFAKEQNQNFERMRLAS